ncbi:MAG TPA: hypothetical protein VKA19_06915 [Alphaproteobacteria bacterium]|nr:hypothetical protein [Alphaproteobacteria bacterium]
MKPTPKRLAVLLTLVGTLALTGCSTIWTTTPTTATSCIVFDPITYSAAEDSDNTIMQIRVHNRVWDALCKKEGR